MAQRESVCQRLSGWFEEASISRAETRLIEVFEESHAVTEQIGRCLLCLGFYTETEWLIDRWRRICLLCYCASPYMLPPEGTVS